MIAYRFLLPAEEEMTEAAVFYEAASARLGSDFLDDVQRVIDLVRGQPSIGRQVGQGLRRMLLHKFPFSLIYAVDTEEIVIVAIAHQKRQPDYWKGRL
jgi:plasmid stabilization system protein ParE